MNQIVDQQAPLSDLLTPVQPTISGTPPSGDAGVPYPPFTFTTTGTFMDSGRRRSCEISSGALPPGMQFNGNTCVLYGTPTTDGAFDFVVSARGPGGTTAMPVTQTIALGTPLMNLEFVSLLVMMAAAMAVIAARRPSARSRRQPPRARAVSVG